MTTDLFPQVSLLSPAHLQQPVVKPHLVKLNSTICAHYFSLQKRSPLQVHHMGRAH